MTARPINVACRAKDNIEPMSETPVTVGVTCFRERKLLMECWQSVLAQTCHNWQSVMVMDGGADAETAAVFHSINHPRLRKFVNSENKGAYATRNRAFEETKTALHYY